MFRKYGKADWIKTLFGSYDIIIKVVNYMSNDITYLSLFQL